MDLPCLALVQPLIRERLTFVLKQSLSNFGGNASHYLVKVEGNNVCLRQVKRGDPAV